MPNILEISCYRELIKELSKPSKITQRQIAVQTGIHSSYFSRVMKGNADFSEEQLYEISKVLGLYHWQIEYFLLLGAYSRSGNYQHQLYLQRKIDACRQANSKLISKLRDVSEPLSEENIALYYQSPATAKVHMHLTIPKNQSNLAQLQKRLGFSSDRFEKELDKLESLKIIERDKDRVELLKTSIHLDESHPSSNGNHKNWRLETLQRLNADDPRPSDYHLSANFSCSEKTVLQIKEILKKAVVDSQARVSESKTVEEVYHLGIDLY